MTGSTLSGVPGSGTWSTVFDSQIVGAEWGKIGWTARLCGDASLIVSVSSSTNGTTFGPAQVVTNGADPTVANGRFLRIVVNFKRSASGETPVLYDLSVGTSGFTLPVVANEPPTVSAGNDSTITLPDVAKLSGISCDDGFPRGSSLALSWSKVSGPGDVAFTKPNSPLTDASFTVAGTYVLRLTASDSEHSVSADVTVTALPANAAPIVNAGPNQTITLPNTANLTGTASDDGFPAGAIVTTFWGQLSGPGLVTFNEPNSLSTKAIFSTPGTYVLRLTASDSHRIGTDDIQIVVNASPALTGATLQLVAAAPGPYVTGTPQTVRATLRNSAGNPLANFGVEFTVAGPNATTGSAVTNTSGIATFTYAGTNPGTDAVTALVRSTATANINGTPPVSMVWTLTPQSPAVTQGWIGAPLNGASVTGTVPITVAAGQTLTNAKVEYWPASNPAAVTTLVEGAQGGPGTTLTSIDTTLLANGNYVIRVTATNGNGEEQVSQVTITVTGENKPGRMTVNVTDLVVPVTGIPITIERQYDSLERNQVGDFGFGWALEMSGPRLEVSPDNDVTITEPGTGRRVTFQFTPTSFGFPFGFLYQPVYTPEPGVFGKLSSNGCGLLIRSGAGVACFLSLDINYSPTAFAYTDPYGRVYTMTSAGKMVSIKNIDGTLLTFGPNGITSSAGNLSVAFGRDAQGRIEQITDPAGKVYRYTYDGVGDLVSVALPDVPTPLTYEYNPGHFFRKGTDARGNTEASSTYFPNGRLQSITNAMGKTTSYTYDLVNNITTTTHPDNTGSTIQRFDSNGLLLSETNPLNQTRNYTYDANRNKRTETDALNKTTSFDYDANGHLKTVTDPLNKSLTFVNNSNGLPVTATDQNNKTRTLQYDANSNLTNLSDELGSQLAMTWNDRGNPLTFTNANGKVTHFTYDAYGHVISKTDALGRTTSYTYDGMGRIETVTDANGVSHFTYDALGRLLSVIDALNHETRYRYDANGNRIEEIDARQNSTKYEYDAANRLIKTTYPDQTTYSYTYNFRDQKETETDQQNRTTRYVYDNAGRMVKIIRHDQSEVTITYDAIGRTKTVTDERNKTVTYEYDPSCSCRDRVAKVIDPTGAFSTYTYDAAGRRTSFVDANNRETRYEYDVRNRLTKTTFADNTFIQYSYDATGHVSTTTDQEGRLTKNGYDDVGNLTSITDAKNQVTQYTYDSLNNLESSTNGNGKTTRFEYDALNRVIKRVLPLGMQELYTYDQVGNLATRLDFRGKQSSYDYDSMNRPLARTPDASLGETPITFTYTPTGQRLTMNDASGTTRYGYDVRDNLITKETPQGTLTYTYDVTRNLTSMRSSNVDGVSVDYTYDDMNRLATVIDNRLGTTTYTYDPVGNLKSDRRPNAVQQDYTYNAINRLTNLTVAKTGTNLASYAFTLDKTGRRLSVTEQSGRTVNYTYDTVYQLTREAVSGDPDGKNGSVDYTFDNVGNRMTRISSLAGVLSATSNYDANDRLTTDSFDANGNTRVADGRSFTYDFENRIKTVNGGAVRVVYDGDGNLAAKTVGAVTTRFLVDELNPTGYSQVVEEVVNGEVQRQYTYGNSIVSQRQLIAGTWVSSFYNTDGHGSVRQLTNESAVVTDTYTYDAYGKVISQTGSTPNVYLYSGERFDPDLGLYHLRARYYNVDRGRFMSLDPYPGDIDEPSSIHKYLYAHADPVNFVDPTGMSETAEYGRLTTLILRLVQVLRRLGRAIACIFLKVASVIAAMVGYEEWAAVLLIADQLFLRHCPCWLNIITYIPDFFPPAPRPTYPGPYSNLPDHPSVGPGKEFSPRQKRKILDENRRRNGGRLISDSTGLPLDPPTQGRKGVTPSPNEAVVDHINPRNPADPNIPRGTNSNKNARVISRGENGVKSNKCIL
ncbi:MAG TPA: RHS repeat-associated core domain-containing protein [Pyrinomonadaceae bacterium]|nr:RHS repeat-associated core domain-containing protein [Pyrinomonadaceae bacterium]